MQTFAIALATFLLPSTVAAGVLGLHAEPVPAPAPAPFLAPAPAPPPIRPGVVVRLTDSKEQLLKDFSAGSPAPGPAPAPIPGAVGLHAVAQDVQASAAGIRYVPLMDEMLGHDFVIKELKYGGVGLPSADGSQGGVWYFPFPSIKLWSETKQGKAAPLPRLAAKVAGQPTRTRANMVPPGAGDAPWDYKIQGANLMRPVAPPLQEAVDFEKTDLRLPTYMKVKSISSVECLEKIHKDPEYVCKPEEYTNYVPGAPPPPAPTTTMSPAETEKLKKRIRHLESTIRSLTRPSAKYDSSVKHPGIEITGGSMNKAVKWQERMTAVKGDPGKDLRVSIKKFRDSEQTLPTAQGHSERPCAKKPTGPGDGT